MQGNKHTPNSFHFHFHILCVDRQTDGHNQSLSHNHIASLQKLASAIKASLVTQPILLLLKQHTPIFLVEVHVHVGGAGSRDIIKAYLELWSGSRGSQIKLADNITKVLGRIL